MKNRDALVILIFSPLLFADVFYIESINDVFNRGDHELLAAVTVEIGGDDFMNASPENPIFLMVSFDKQVVLAHTLVDLTSNDPETNLPIYLPMWVKTPDGNPNVDINASPETVSIVRWVTGENAIWVRIQTSSTSWVQIDSTNVGPPSNDHRIRWTLGISARLSWSNLAEKLAKNLPFATRNPNVLPESLDQAVSTLFCMDLSNSTVGATGVASTVNWDPLFFDSTAEEQLGVYAPGNRLPIRDFGSFTLGRGKKRMCAAFLASRPNQVALCDLDNGLTSVSNRVEIDLLCESGGEFMDQSLHDGARITLSVGNRGNYGFDEEGAAFLGEDIPPGMVEVDPNSAFMLEGRKLYRTLALFWTGGSRNLHALFRITLNATLTLSCNERPPTDLAVDFSIDIPSNSGALDDPPFDGPFQIRRCEPSPIRVATGIWLLVEPSATNHLAHVTRVGQGFTTEIIFANIGETPQHFILFPFAMDGTPLPMVMSTIEAQRTLSIPVEMLFENDEVAHFRILAEETLKVTAVYQSEREGTGPAHVSVKGEEAGRWRIYPGNHEITWDGVAIVNRGGTTTGVRISQFNGEAELLDEVVAAASLDPGEKILAVLSDLFEEITNSYYEVWAPQPLGIISLRGDLDSHFLWENPAIPLSLE